MLSKFYPAHYVESAYKINYEKLYQEGYRGIIFDIDNTLVPHGFPADDRALRLFASLKKMGFKCCLLSNNKEGRVSLFNNDAKVYAIWDAHKPAKKNYYKAMELMETNKNNTIFIGDQLFTDVWGAKNAGIENFLVKPIHPKEEIQIVLKRYLEKIVLWSYNRALKRKKVEK